MSDTGYAEKFDAVKRERYLEILRTGGRRRAAARMCGVHPETVRRYREKHPGFAREASAAEAEANEVVENALFVAATQDKNVTAMTVWLYNRAPTEWSDRKVLKAEHTGKVDSTVEVTLDSSSYVREVLADPEATEMALDLLDRVATRVVDGPKDDDVKPPRTGDPEHRPRREGT